MEVHLQNFEGESCDQEICTQVSHLPSGGVNRKNRREQSSSTQGRRRCFTFKIIFEGIF